MKVKNLTTLIEDTEEVMKRLRLFIITITMPIITIPHTITTLMAIAIIVIIATAISTIVYNMIWAS